MIDLDKISYQDCDVVKRYTKDIDACDTLKKLKERLAYWEPLAKDAYKIVNRMNEKDFISFRKALKLERLKMFSNNEEAMTILMPMPMFKISEIANHFHVPFGCALHRAMDEGMLK